MLVDIIGNNRTPQHLPIGSLKRFGTNQYSEPMFRIVWSESRYYLVGAKHTEYDGDPSNDAIVRARGKDPNLSRIQACYKWLPLYPNTKAWVLEKWMSPIQFTGCSPEQYEIQTKDPTTGLLLLGPYPSRGEYVQSFTFPSQPTISVAEMVINRIRAGWNYSYNDHVVANREERDKRIKDIQTRRGEIYMDAQQAFKNRPSNIRPGKKTRDRFNMSKSAEQVGLHRKGFSTSI